mgnify:CR=1 FL=1
MILSRYERMIAKRYLLPGKGEGFIFLVASISLVAVMLGVAALMNGHAIIQGYGGQLRNWQDVLEDVRRTPGVVSATPLIEQPLMASYEGRVEGVLARGMRVADIRANPVIRSKVIDGALAELTPGSDNVAIGARLADALGARVGGSISLISPQGQTTPFGTVPRIVSYRVAAIFEVGVYDYDKAFVVMPIEDAQTLLLMGNAVGMIEVKTEDPDRVGEILAPLVPRIGAQGVITDWRQMNASLFEALEVERVAMFVVLSIIVLVAVFNILSSLIMLVRAKTRDIAILRTMGASRRSMMKVFVTVGVTIGTLGIVLGLILGAIFLFFRQNVVNFIQLITGQNLWDPSVRFLSELPSKTDPVEVAAIVLTALVLSFLSTLYPAWKAAGTDPVQVLRYE